MFRLFFLYSLSVFLFSSHLVALIRPTIRSNGIDIESMESMCAYFIAFLFFLANLFFFLVGFFSRKINLNAIAAIIDLVYAMCALIGMFLVVVVYCCSVFLHRYAWIVMILFGWQRKVDHLISTIQSRRCARKYYFACSWLYSSISRLNNWLTEWTLDKHKPNKYIYLSSGVIVRCLSLHYWRLFFYSIAQIKSMIIRIVMKSKNQ